MTNQQANTTINLLRDIFARQQTIHNTEATILNGIINAINSVENTITDFASLFDNWMSVLLEKSWIIIFVMMIILTLCSIKTFRDR